ncbi:TORTIFOLIA1-like protein 4, partial [Linum perenne]
KKSSYQATVISLSLPPNYTAKIPNSDDKPPPPSPLLNAKKLVSCNIRFDSPQVPTMSSQKRSSPISPAASPGADLKPRVIACLNKLSDRDTLAVATAELESIGRSLTHDSFSPFLNCIHNTDSSSKSPVRKQCVSLLTLLSHSHGNSLSPHLSKMVSTVARRLRDPDSAVRSACVEATTAMSSRVTDPPFSTVSKPLIEMLTVEQDLNAQIGAAMCLAAAIEAAPEPGVEQLRKVLPRLGKLVKGEGFKAKAALLSVIGNIVGVGGAASKSVLDWLVPCLVDLLSCEDWAARKAAAEALGKVAVADKEAAKDHRTSCLSSLENRRFDKVKVVRETMNRTLELWKNVNGGSEQEFPSPNLSRSSSAGGPDNGNGGYTRSYNNVGSKTPPLRKSFPPNRSPPSDASAVTTAKKQSPARSNDSNSRPALPQKLDHRRTSAWKVEIAVPREKSCEDDIKLRESKVPYSSEEVKNGGSPETKRVLFTNNSEISKVDKPQRSGGFRSGSRVVPYNDDDDAEDNPAEDMLENPKEIEDLSLIRAQLVQIENQQSNLLDLLQRFMGSSQNGINSLESRVHGLEMALDEISHDLALSSGRIPNAELATENRCCKLPGTDFLSSKLWRRTDGGQYSPRNTLQVGFDKDFMNGGRYLPNGRTFQQRYNKCGLVANSFEDFHNLARSNSGLSPRQAPIKLLQGDTRSPRAAI